MTETTFVMVKNGEDSDWPQMFGPFESDDEAREWAEENFSRRVWTTVSRVGDNGNEWA